MAILPFDAKYPELLADPIFGWPNVHIATKEMMSWLCDFCEKNKLPRPVLTEVGRSREDQIACYLTTFVQIAEQLNHGAPLDEKGRAWAYQSARNKFSWHCVPNLPTGPGNIRAFDIREWVYNRTAQEDIYEAARERYPPPMYEVLLHAVPGGAKHFHFGTKDPGGVPPDWL